MEKFDEVDVVLLLAEVLLQEEVDAAFKHEGVVDGDHPDLRHEVPTWVSTAGLGGVHDVVADQEEGLQQFDHPA